MVATSRIVRKTFVKVPTNITGPTRVKVGFPAGKSDGEIINRAIWNEFGTRGGGWGGPIPERPFMRNAHRNNHRRYRQLMTTAAMSIVTGKATLEQVLEKLGALAQGDIQMEITSLRTPPNSPVTVKLKGSSNPLIDTGAMRQAVTWEVVR